MTQTIPQAGPRCRFGRQHVWALCYPWSVLAKELGLDRPAFVCSECGRANLSEEGLAEAESFAA